MVHGSNDYGRILSLAELCSLLPLILASLHRAQDATSAPDTTNEEYCDGFRWIHTKPDCMKGKAEYVQLEHNEWPKRYEACGDAVEQSPIHVHYLDSRFLQFKPLYFAGFENHYSYVVENGMHGLYLTLVDGTVSLYGGPLAVRHNLSRAILRFGRPTRRGSEHRIDDAEHVAELLFSSKKPTPTRCLHDNYGAAIVSVLYREVPGSVAALEPLVESTRQLRGVWGARTPVELRLSALMAPLAQHYYAYSGSLTFPPCTSRIPTLVMARAATIGEDQMDALRRNMYVSLNYCVYHMAGQLRPIFDARNRDVYRSFKYFESPADYRRPHSLLAPLLLLSLALTTAEL
ncbi:carbonic anhydrase 3-like isoform X2 [Amblyomma americanum]